MKAPRPPSPAPHLVPDISTGSLGFGGQLCHSWRCDLGQVYFSLDIWFPIFPARSRISASPKALGASSAAPSPVASVGGLVFSFSALTSRLCPRGRRRMGCWQELPEPSPGSCWGVGSGRGGSGASPSGCQAGPPLSAAGGQPGGCGCGGPLPRPGRWLQLGSFRIGKKRERERQGGVGRGERMTRPAGWQRKRLKEKRAGLFPVETLVPHKVSVPSEGAGL